MRSLHSTQVGIALPTSFEHLTCPATKTTIKTIMTLLLLFYMVPYSLTPPSMKGLLLQAKTPCCVAPPLFVRGVAFGRWFILGPPLKLLSVLCDPGRLEFTPWPTFGKAMLAPNFQGNAFQVTLPTGIFGRFRLLDRPPWNCSVCCYRTPLSYRLSKTHKTIFDVNNC